MLLCTNGCEANMVLVYVEILVPWFTVFKYFLLTSIVEGRFTALHHITFTSEHFIIDTFYFSIKLHIFYELYIKKIFVALLSLFDFSLNFWIHSVIIKLLPCLVLTVISFILIHVLYQAAKRRVKLKGYNEAASASNIDTVLNGHR